MKGIYLDNASTSFPKAPLVANAISDFILNGGCNINRGGYESAYEAEELVYETRRLLCSLFNGDDCKLTAFTKNITESLNIVLKGLLRPGDDVLVSSMEHNAVMRPLVQLSHRGISFRRIPCLCDGSLPTQTLEQTLLSLIKPSTRAVVMTHASNVCGTVLPIAEVGEICRRHGIFFIVDSAQTAGILPIDMKKYNISALCFTGHKGLLGPQGIGGFLLRHGLEKEIEPLLSGGTGSLSHTEDVPSFMPDRFEAGTLNLPGIVGLNASLKYLDSIDNGTILAHELMLTQRFLTGLEDIDGVLPVGKTGVQGRVGVVSVSIPSMDIAQAAYRLDSEYGIMTRVGLHCAPSAHKTLNTFPTGTLRFSFGYQNTSDEIDFALDSLKRIVSGSR